MSTATRNSSQNKRMKITSPTSRVANSSRNDNYKVRDETSREQGARSKERGARSKEQGARSKERGAGSRGSGVSFCHYATTPLLRLSVLHAPCSLLLRKPVFRPGIGGVAVAADFPETRLIFGNEFNRANELGPFPGIKLRDNHARGTAVIAHNRFAIELRGHEGVVVERIFDSDIGGIVIVAAKENVTHFRFRFYNFGQSEKSDTAPVAIEFAPGGDAMKI